MSQEVDFKVRPVAGYETTHLVTSDGQVFRKTRLGGKVHPYTYIKQGYICRGRYITKSLRGNWLKPQLNSYGYNHIVLSRGHRTRTIHRIVAETFIPNPKKLPQINHKDGIKTNNRVENLEWCTASHNVRHAYANGLAKVAIGNKSHRTIIPDEELQVIRYRFGSGERQSIIAKDYGVDQSHISRIVNFHKRGRVTV